jgi:hypothetical protein
VAETAKSGVSLTHDTAAVFTSFFAATARSSENQFADAEVSPDVLSLCAGITPKGTTLAEGSY